MEFDINPNELSLQGPDGMQLVQILRKLIVAIDGGDEPEPVETSGLYYCTYGTTTSAQIAQAITDGLLPVCVYGGKYYYLAYRQVNIFTFASVDQTQLILYRIKCNGSNWSFNSSYLQSLLDFDYAPTQGSTNPVTSGGVWTAIQQGGGGSDIDPYQQYPAMDGTASPGSSDDYARGDHVHPTDTSRAAASEITRIDAALATKADQADIQQTIEDSVDDWLTTQAPSIGTMSYAAKRALLNLLQHVAYDHANDAQYYNALERELFPDSTLESINAVFTQGSAVIYASDSLDTLKQYLVVTATYSDSTTETITDYTLSGTLSAGTSTITVSYGGKTDTFTVNVNGIIWLYKDGDEVTNITGGWDVGTGFITNANRGIASKANDGLSFTLTNSASTGHDVALSISTHNPVNLTPYSKLVVELIIYRVNSTGTINTWAYLPSSLNTANTQSSAYGSDYSSHRVFLGNPSDIAIEVPNTVENSITDQTGERYVSFNFNPYGGAVTGTYMKILKAYLVPAEE